MCGRYTLTAKEEELKSVFELTTIAQPYTPVYNVCPTMLMPVITNTEPHVLQFYRWGLIPKWAKDKRIGAKMINARAETLAEKPAFKHALHHARCLVPANGYFEWLTHGKTKTPYCITTCPDGLMAFAGLWAVWQNEANVHETISSFTIITVPAQPSIAHIHNRMPLVLMPQQYRLWLSDVAKPADVLELLRTPDTMNVAFYEVGKQVNYAAHNSLDVLLPV
ncbi:MAG TPA: SOS response-associated peptidase [Chitinophagales bacterium]|nr:SOS response-associated peptidase [Chitinophagales bacterium]HRK25694.1 SOS response-associated peptidase [Chitinophagales bacterium]